jgi:hypothetical protein
MRISKGYRELSNSDLHIKRFEIDESLQNPLSTDIALSSKWISDSKTTIRMQIELDMESISKSFSLSQSDSFTGVLRSYCKYTKLQHFSANTPLIGKEMNLELTIPSFEWGEQADLKLSIAHDIVDQAIASKGRAILNKSRLFEQSWSLLLSGSYSRSDVQSVKFIDGDGKGNSLWEIMITPPSDIDSWITTEQSAVVHIRVNQVKELELENTQVELLLKVDMIMSSLDAIFGNAVTEESRSEIIDLICSPPVGSGSWLKFLSFVFPIAFPNGSIGATQFWHSRKDEIRARIQSYLGGV